MKRTNERTARRFPLSFFWVKLLRRLLNLIVGIEEYSQVEEEGWDGQVVYVVMFCSFIQPLLTVLSRMGQIQQLRMHLNQKLSLLSSSRSQYLHSCLLTLNKAILHDIEAHTLNPKHKPYPSEDPLLGMLMI